VVGFIFYSSHPSLEYLFLFIMTLRET